MEILLRWLGGLAAWGVLALLMMGIWQGLARQAGRVVGRAGWLRSLPFYVLGLAAFLGFSWLGWRPLPVTLARPLHGLALPLGALLYFPGLSLIAWGRLALGSMYFVSTGLGAQLFSGHRLVTGGPYAIVRHPMYLGLIAAAAGGLLIYQTWTTLAYALFAPLVLRRARREEQALAEEFGPQWMEYCRRVPALFPWRRRKE
jgi:protein-S-isoprenylcysteine O-methyltransferase Ste14